MVTTVATGLLLPACAFRDKPRHHKEKLEGKSIQPRAGRSPFMDDRLLAAAAKEQGTAARGGPVPQATTQLNHAGEAGGELGDDGRVHRVALKRAVQVDHVEVRRALARELPGLCHGVLVEHRRALEVALHHAHRGAVAQVDCGEELDHAATASPVRTPPSQRPIRARPAVLDFSGWNCTPVTHPRPAAAVNDTP